MDTTHHHTDWWCSRCKRTLRHPLEKDRNPKDTITGTEDGPVVRFSHDRCGGKVVPGSTLKEKG